MNKNFVIGLGVIALCLGIIGLISVNGPSQTAQVGNAITANTILTSISPMPAMAGGALTINGGGFGNGEAYKVRFVDSSGEVTVVPINARSTIALSVAAPASLQPGVYKVSVDTARGAGGSNNLNLVIVPQVVSVAPVSGRSGDRVTLVGKGFSTVDSTTVSFEFPGKGEIQAVGKSLDSTKLVVTIPTIKASLKAVLTDGMAYVKAGTVGVDGWSNKLPFAVILKK
jgi:hypothetical protein